MAPYSKGCCSEARVLGKTANARRQTLRSEMPRILTIVQLDASWPSFVRRGCCQQGALRGTLLNRVRSLETASIARVLSGGLVMTSCLERNLYTMLLSG